MSGRTASLLCLWLPAAVTAGGALAEPCVGTAFDKPLPGAEAVERRFADVASALYPGLWQQGRISGLSYRLFMDLSGNLSDGQPLPEWEVSFSCSEETGSCSQSFEGLAPIAALRISDALGRCLLGAEITEADFAEPPIFIAQTGLPADAAIDTDDRQPKAIAGLAAAAGIVSGEAEAEAARNAPPVEAVASDRPTGFPAADGSTVAATAPHDGEQLGPNLMPPQTCGLGSIDRGTSPTLTIQRLLASGGYDPGPIDGMMGARTWSALAEALGARSLGQMTLNEVILALDVKLCSSSRPDDGTAD